MFYITDNFHEPTDKEAILQMCLDTQKITGIPDPSYYDTAALDKLIFSEEVLRHLIAIDDRTTKVIGHIAVTRPNPAYLPIWLEKLNNETDSTKSTSLFEVSRLFVKPSHFFRGIGSALVKNAIEMINSEEFFNGTAVSSVWFGRGYVESKFQEFGGRIIANNIPAKPPVTEPTVNLYAFAKK